MCEKEGGQKNADKDLCFFSFGPNIGARLGGLLGQQKEKKNKNKNKQLNKTQSPQQGANKFL